MTFDDAYYKTPHRKSVKFPHYIPIYERHLHEFVGKPVGVMEIGIGVGGFLQVLQAYLGPQAMVYGLDQHGTPGDWPESMPIFTGLQQDPNVLAEVRQKTTLSVIIDDGGHLSEEQQASFEALYPNLQTPGLYIIEDTQLSYAPKYGGFKKPGTFIEYLKDRLDDLNAWCIEPADRLPNDFTRTTYALHWYYNLVVVEKRLADLRSPVHCAVP